MEPANNPTKRAPVTLKIKFKSGTIDEFVQRYAGDISHGGIFIRTKTPLTVGTTLRFEFQLRDANQLMGGDGTVVWIRENDPNRPTMVSGMGVRFDRLNDGSQLVLDRVLAHKGRPSQVIASPAVSFDDSTKENTSQGYAPGRYAPTISDSLDDDKTIQRTAAPGGDGDEPDEFSDVPNQSTKIRPLSEIAQQLAAHEGAAGVADISEQRTMPGVGLIGESTRPLSISDLADAVPVDDPTIAMAAPVFPEHSASADSDAYALPSRTKPAQAAPQIAPAASAGARPKSRVGIYAGLGVLLLAAAAIAYIFVLKQDAPPADAIATAPTEPAPIAPTPQPEPAPVAAAVEPAPIAPVPAPEPAPTAPTMLETTIIASAEGATITLVKPPAAVGERVAGASPFAVQAPPDSELNAIVSAPGFRDANVKVRAGETVTATLVALPARAKPAAIKRPPIKPAAVATPSPTPTEPVATPTPTPTEPTTPTAPSATPTTAPTTAPTAPTPPAATPTTTTPAAPTPPPTTTTPAAPTPTPTPTPTPPASTTPAEKPAAPATPPAPTTKEPEPAWVKP